ncbi:hypothetical protein HPB50_005417 [Hyalomma asiaticum]|uniref:Uncharacterized protein n=1 Tax=Hyalomma asiaticum TaxID=266040 RepID=A0ACB7RHH8_HYAAI|nr:hypothetical protein HPB50_005417 [Hyalomma asiaticum]
MDATQLPGKTVLAHVARSNTWRFGVPQGQGARITRTTDPSLVELHLEFTAPSNAGPHFTPWESLEFLTSPADFRLPPHAVAQAEAQEAPFQGPDRLRCQHCGLIFQRRQDLSAHRRSEHPASGGGRDGARFECSFCGVTFSQRCHLTKHRMTHTGERPYACHICQRRFTQKTHMVEHVRIHTGERPYRCEECQATFTQKTHLVGHLRTHTGERPFKCSGCGKAFSTSSSLSRHRFVAHCKQQGEEEQ